MITIVNTVIGAAVAASMIVGALILVSVGATVMVSALTVAYSLGKMYISQGYQTLRIKIRKRRIIKSNLTLVYST